MDIQFVFREYNRHGDVIFEWHGTAKDVDAYLNRHAQFMRCRDEHTVRMTTDIALRERRHEKDRNLH